MREKSNRVEAVREAGSLGREPMMALSPPAEAEARLPAWLKPFPRLPRELNYRPDPSTTVSTVHSSDISKDQLSRPTVQSCLLVTPCKSHADTSALLSELASWSLIVMC